MSRIVRALFVGIDRYDRPVNSLKGCVNDVEALRDIIGARAKAAGDQFFPKTLIDEEATREKVIETFREHLGVAKAGEVVLFFFAGHGSQEQAPPEFWNIEPDRLNETLVCHDSRQTGKWDLADKELAKLISEAAEGGAHVAVILDCCHSGSGTRNSDRSGVRRVTTDTRVRSVDAYLGSSDLLKTRASGASKEPAWGLLPKGRHILLAACRADEEAKEYSIGEETRGVFSHFLGESLSQVSGPVTYRDIFRKVSAMVRTHAALQSPQAEPTEIRMLDEGFLGASVPPTAPFYTLALNSANEWTVDAGAVHGIPELAGEERTIFAVFPFGSKPEDWVDAEKSLGTATVTAVAPDHSKVVPNFSRGKPVEREVYVAVLSSLPIPALKIVFEGAEEGVALAREALAEASDTRTPSLLLTESTIDDAALRLVAVKEGGGNFRTVRPGDGRRLLEDVPALTKESATRAIEQLEHIARWMRIVELQNPGSQLRNEIAWEILTVEHEGDTSPERLEGNDARLHYIREGNLWREPLIKVSVTNVGKRTLYCAVVGLTPSFAIVTDLLPVTKLKPGETAYVYEGHAFGMNVPDALWNAGIIEVKDTLKLICSTSDFNTSLLEQADLGLPFTRTTRSVEVSNVLDHLMARVRFRAFSRPAKKLTDWSTSEFSITTVRPQESLRVPLKDEVTIFPGVRIMGHPALEASVRLASAPVASRDMNAEGGVVMPPLLHDDPESIQPFFFSTSRSGEPGLGVLEIHDIKDPRAVTRDAPLVLQIDQPLELWERLLATSYDGEFFLPVGRGAAGKDGAEVRIQALPTPVQTRTLTSAVKIYFQKVSSKYFGSRYEYPLLATFTAGGEVQSNGDPAEVKKKVAAASRILLYVHGIIGETRNMAESSAGLVGPPTVPGLAGHYDLILTFDYENLDTPIQEIARSLKSRLADAGLRSGHGKVLDVVAHSMGGLVCRWFIEREGGNDVVRRLVMLGTPNGGTPWSTIEDWSIAMLSFGLNALSPVPWAGKVVAGLLAGIEKIDVTLDQMKGDSELLADLNASADPGIPYFIVAGNTSLISKSKVVGDARQSLIERLKSLNLLHGITSPAFLFADNDIAVSVESIRLQPEGRQPQSEVYEVACDHITYFSTVAGLQPLETLLRTVDVGKCGIAE